ncbi:MAG: hypothetical protein HOP06_06495 [Methylotenera sp.]|nr:hypothetical protein [Methylotenera sp.]
MGKYLLNEKLAHFSEAQVDTFLSRYYQGEKCTPLLAIFAIDVHANAVSQWLPIDTTESAVCPNCGSSMFIKYAKRKSSIKRYQKVMHCNGCEHVPTKFCHCAYCRQKCMDERTAQKLQVSNAISAYCRLNLASVYMESATELSLKHAVALLALVRCCDRLADSTFGALVHATMPFAPNNDWGVNLLRSLMNAKLLSISEGTSEKHFIIESQHIEPRYGYVNWEIQLENIDAIILDIENLCRAGNIPSNWQRDLPKLRQELALAECKELYTFCLDERGLPSEVGAKAEAMLLDILVDHSVAQCYQAIRYAAMRTLDFKTVQRKNNLPVQHYQLPSYMVNTCQNYVDRARLEGLNNKGFSRNAHIPRSMMSVVLYDTLLKMGERGFTEPYHSAVNYTTVKRLYD